MLKIDFQNYVYKICINRPDVRNAFNDELIEEMHLAWDCIPAEARVIVISSEGSVFSAGADLNWMKKTAGYTEDKNIEDAKKLANLFLKISNSPAPVIARVQGNAFGGGTGLIAACDIAIASSHAKFAFSEVKLGLIPATISKFVIDKIGKSHARSLFLTGEIFNALKAFHIGLVHEICSLDQLDILMNNKIQNIFTAGPSSILESRRLVQDYPVCIEDSAKRLARQRASAEGKEGVQAFLDKRPADFVIKND